GSAGRRAALPHPHRGSDRHPTLSRVGGAGARRDDRPEKSVQVGKETLPPPGLCGIARKFGIFYNVLPLCPARTPMKIVCDNCSTKYSIADEKVRGKVFKIKCKKCSHIIVVKGAPAPEQPQAGFDQKDTRVFDYSGFEGGRGGAVAAAAQDAIWHLVIDREQVGPLTLAEVQGKFDSGEADAESYVWREGFADWQRLGSVGELAAIAKSAPAADKDRGAVARSDGPADLFGTPRTEEGQAGLFAAPRAPPPQPAGVSPHRRAGGH